MLGRLLMGLLVPAVIPAAMTAGDGAVLQGLDKVTARVSRLEAPVDKPVRFGTLEVFVRTCFETPPEEPPESAAFIEIYEARPGEERVRVFSGWMFASSPALSAMEHPVYDVWVVDCMNDASSAASSSRSNRTFDSSAPASSDR